MSESGPSLFRQHAVAHKAPKLFGGTIVRFGKTHTVLTVAAVTLALALILVLLFGNYERRERVPGYLTPTPGLVRVVPPRAGLITSLAVNDGQLVAVEQPLFSVSPKRGMAGGLDADAETVEGLIRERTTINARITREGLLAEMRSQDALRRIDELKRQLPAVQSQKNLATQRADLLNREFVRLESLRAGGHVSFSLMDERRGELLSVQKNVIAFSRELQGLQADLAALQAELELIPLQLAARQDEFSARLLEVERMLIEAEVQRETIVRAPISGRVTSLVAFPGQSVTPNQAMMAILPDESRLQAVLLVPSHAAGFIQPGQQVRLRFDAFPHQRFGVHAGSVYSVSRTMLNPGDQVGPLLLQIPAYRVIATLDEEAVMAYGEAIPLQPDMILQADVIRERMRIIEWIFDPVRAAVSAL